MFSDAAMFTDAGCLMADCRPMGAPVSTSGSVEPVTGGPNRWPRPLELVYWALTVVIVVVIVVVGVRTSAGGWVPTADDGSLVARSRTVFSSSPPLLSTLSSGGASAGELYHHPGPFALYLTAPVIALFGSAWVPFAVAAINAAWVAAIAFVARRATRPAVAAAVMLSTAALVWSMGSGLLTDIWNPHQALLPYLVAMVATWAVLVGRRWALPVGAVACSFAGQTHLAFGVLTLPLVVAMVAVVVAQVIGGRRRDDRVAIRRWSTSATVALAVGVVTSLPPIIEQLANGSDGNLARIARGTGLGTDLIGVRSAKVVVAKAVEPPFFLRGSWDGPKYSNELLTGPGFVVAVVVLVAVSGVAALTARRRRDTAVFWLVAVPFMLAIAGAVFGSRLPERFLVVPTDVMLWAWTIAALLWAGVLARPIERLGGPAGDVGRSRWLTGTTAALAVGFVLAVLAIPAANEHRTGSPPASQEAARRLWRQASEDLVRLDEVEVAASSIQAVQLDLLTGLVNQLEDAGVTARVDDAILVEQMGPTYRSDGSEPWVAVLAGPELDDPPAPGARRLAVSRPASQAAHARTVARLEELVSKIDVDDLVANPSLSDREHTRLYEGLRAEFEKDPERVLLGSQAFADMLGRDLVSVDGVDDLELRRLMMDNADYRSQAVALWLVPRDAWRSQQ